MSNVSSPRQPCFSALQREAELYFNRLKPDEKKIKEAAEKKIQEYASLAMDSGQLPEDISSYPPLSDEHQVLALNLTVSTLPWLREKHLDKIKVDNNHDLQDVLPQLCQFCISELVATKKPRSASTPIKPTFSSTTPPESPRKTAVVKNKQRTGSIPIKADSSSKTPPESPRKKRFLRNKNRADSAPELPKRKTSDSSARGPLQYVMPKAELTPQESIKAISEAFKKLQPDNQKKILSCLENQDKSLLSARDVMQKIHMQSIIGMCKNLNQKERDQLLKTLKKM